MIIDLGLATMGLLNDDDMSKVKSGIILSKMEDNC